MSENGFLDEVRSQFDREVDSKERLDNKASGMIAASGTVVTLLAGFGALVIGGIATTNHYFWYAVDFFLVPVVLSTTSLCGAILAFRLQAYSYPMTYDKLRKDGALTPLYEKLSKMDKQKFTQIAIRSYLKCMEENKPINNSKAFIVSVSQWLLMIGLVLVPFLMLMVALTKF